jgi:hypothetical protein
LRRHQRRSLEPGPDLQRALPGGLDRRGVAEREELREQRQGATVRQRGAHRGDHAFVLRRAAVWHDLRHRRDRPPAGEAAPARAEAGCPHRHHAEQRDQAPGPQILEWALRPASRALRPASFAAAPAAAVLVHLRRDEMALHHGQDRLALLQAQPQRRCGMPGRRALAGADLVHLRRAIGPGQFQHDPPLHCVHGL